MNEEKARNIAEKIKHALSDRGGMWSEDLDEDVEEEIMEEITDIIVRES